MERQEWVFRRIESAGLAAFIAYLEDQLQDNGQNGTPLFQPQSAHDLVIAPERVDRMRASLSTPVGEEAWRRAWGAFDANGTHAAADADAGTSTIKGHIDLRAHPGPCTAHRALLGMGVHRAHRGQGLGRSLVDFVTAWALQNTVIEWIDLDFLAGNVPAERLYRSVGFEEVATIRDMYRVDGQSVDNVLMTKRIRLAESPTRPLPGSTPTREGR